MNVISFSKSKQSSAAGSSGGGLLNSINAELKALLDRLGDLKNLEVESLNTYYLDASTANIIDSSITNLNVSTGKFKYIDASLGKFDELDASLMKIDDLDVSLLHSKKILNDSSIVTKELDASIIKSTNIDNLDSIITKNLTVTGSAHFFELIIDLIKSAGGSLLLTPADGFVIDEVEEEIEYNYTAFASRMLASGGKDVLGTGSSGPEESETGVLRNTYILDNLRATYGALLCISFTFGTMITEHETYVINDHTRIGIDLYRANKSEDVNSATKVTSDRVFWDYYLTGEDMKYVGNNTWKCDVVRYITFDDIKRKHNIIFTSAYNWWISASLSDDRGWGVTAYHEKVPVVF